MCASLSGCFPNGRSIPCIRSVEFDHIPTEVLSNGTSNRGFADTRGANQQNGFFLWRAVLPIIKPCSNFPTLNFIALKVTFRSGSMALCPVAHLRHDRTFFRGFFNMYHASGKRTVEIYTRSLMWTRFCSPLLRSLTVTVLSSRDWWSTVMQFGTPISSALA